MEITCDYLHPAKEVTLVTWSATTGTVTAADGDAARQVKNSRTEGKVVNACKCHSDFRSPIPNQDTPILSVISWRSEHRTQFLSSTSLPEIEDDELKPYPLQASYFL